jgi:single-strand DNA-binding protein
LISKTIIIGNLGNDPETRFTQGGKQVTTFSVATTERWKGQDGQMNEETEWHKCVAWDKLAVICGDYLKKGSKVYCEGQNRTRKWQDQSGNDRYTTEIKLREMKMLDPKGGSPQQGGRREERHEPHTPGNNTGSDIPF